MATPPIVAVEGPCCAGKTTLSQALVRELTGLGIAHVRCYADHVGGGRFLPPAVPRTLDEDEAGLAELIGLERDRMAPALAAPADLILADRGVHTLLAHRFAIEAVTGLACFEPAKRALEEAHLTSWPRLVVYLDVPQQTVLARNNGKFPDDSIFIDAQFNKANREYFTRLAEFSGSHVVWLDATLEPAKLVTVTQAQMMNLLRERDR